MKIRDLIDLLEQYEHDSEAGQDTIVKVNLSVGEWSVNCSVPVQIEDVMIAYGGPTEVHVETLISIKNLEKAKADYEKYYVSED